MMQQGLVKQLTPTGPKKVGLIRTVQFYSRWYLGARKSPVLNCPVKLALLITFHVFGSCFRTLAVILVSDFCFTCSQGRD